MASIPPNIPGYNYVRPLGSGGQADVYLYMQNNPQRKVAIKILRNEKDSKSAKALFAQEANLSAQLSGHPHIINIYETSVTPDGRLYIAMEYCEFSLESIIKNRQMSIAEVLEYSINICDILYLSHQNGILHMDIKPSNIFVSDHKVLVLADFGIANKINSNDKTAFSPKWSAPEIIKHKSNGSYRSEIYSVGLTIYAMLAGGNPFDGYENTSKAKAGILAGKINYKINRADIPNELYSIIKKATDINTDTRYSDISEMIADLHAVQNLLGVSQTKVFTTKIANPFSSTSNLSAVNIANTQKYIVTENDTYHRKYKDKNKSSTYNIVEKIEYENKLNKLYSIVTITIILALLLLIVIFLK